MRPRGGSFAGMSLERVKTLLAEAGELLGRTDKQGAIEKYEECQKEAERQTTWPERSAQEVELAIVGNLASVYSMLGENQKAIEYQMKKLALCEGDDKKGEGEALHAFAEPTFTRPTTRRQSRFFEGARNKPRTGRRAGPVASPGCARKLLRMSRAAPDGARAL